VKETAFWRDVAGEKLSGFRILRTPRGDRSAPFGDVTIMDEFGGHFEAPTIRSDGRLIYGHRSIDGKFRIFLFVR